MRSDQHDLVAAYAIDGLPPEEAAQFEAHLQKCLPCRTELGQLLSAVGELSVLGEAEPPPQMREAVLGGLSRTSQVERAKVVPEIRRRPPIARRVLAVAAVSLAVLALGGLALSLLTDSTGVSDIEAMSDSREVALISANGANGRFVYSTQNGRAALIVEDLAQLGGGQIYELWYVAESGPRGVKLFNSDSDNRVEAIVEADLNDVAVVAVTIEPAGGSVAPTGEIFLSAELA